MKHKSILVATENAIFPYSPKEKKEFLLNCFFFSPIPFLNDECTALSKIPFHQPMIKYLVRNKIKRHLNPSYFIYFAFSQFTKFTPLLQNVFILDYFQKFSSLRINTDIY